MPAMSYLTSPTTFPIPTGLITNAAIMLPGVTFSEITFQGADPTAPLYDLSLQGPTANDLMNVVLSNTPSGLVTAMGGDIVSGTATAGTTNYFALAATLSPIAGGTPIPEPSTIILFSTGLIALAVAIRHRITA